MKPSNDLKNFRKLGKSRYRNKGERMTLIIGARFKDGVILVSDRKVTNTESPHNPEWTNKLQTPYPNTPLCLGTAGYVHLYKQFNRKIIEIAGEKIRETELRNVSAMNQLGLNYKEAEEVKEPQKLNKKDIEIKIINDDELHDEPEPQKPYIYSIENFMEDSQDLVRKLCTGRDGITRPDLDVLLIVSVNNQARLHHINFVGDEEELNYCAIGSGSDYVKTFLKKFWREDMSIDEIINLAYFCIYYVQDLDFDGGVGVEDGMLPDHFVVTHDGKHGFYTGLESKKAEVKTKIKDKVNKFKEVADALNFN